MPIAADVDGDGNDEVSVGGAFGPSYLFEGNGSLRLTYAAGSEVAATFTTSGAFGNFGLGLSYAQPGSDGHVAHRLAPAARQRQSHQQRRARLLRAGRRTHRRASPPPSRGSTSSARRSSPTSPATARPRSSTPATPPRCTATRRGTAGSRLPEVLHRLEPLVTERRRPRRRWRHRAGDAHPRGLPLRLEHAGPLEREQRVVALQPRRAEHRPLRRRHASAGCDPQPVVDRWPVGHVHRSGRRLVHRHGDEVRRDLPAGQLDRRA